MKFHQILSEVSTPTGSIFIRFREKVGEVSANPQRGERSEATYLTAYAGFANAPEDLKQADALRNFNAITSAQDIVNMIKSIFTDKVFLSAKSVTIYDDFTKPMQGDSSPIYKRHPFLLKFMKWVEREGGDQIKIADKVRQEGPPKLKRPRKENPNFGRKLRDVEQGETKKTVTFTVGPRFYKQAQRDLPNLMKYRGPNGTFVMPNDLFMQFRAQAEKAYPYAEIKLVNRVATGEGLNEGSDKSAHDCGIADGYYGRAPNPYKIEMGKRVKLTDPKEIAAYMAGYKDDSVGSKVYENYTINGKKVSKSAYEKEMAKAGKGSKKNKKTTEGIMKYALPMAGAALGGIYGTDIGTAGLDSYVDATTDPIELGTNTVTGEKYTMPASQGAKIANNGAKVLGMKPTGAIGQYSDALDAIQKYGSPVGAALGAGAGMALAPSDRRRNRATDEEDGDTPAPARAKAGIGPAPIATAAKASTIAQAPAGGPASYFKPTSDEIDAKMRTALGHDETPKTGPESYFKQPGAMAQTHDIQFADKPGQTFKAQGPNPGMGAIPTSASAQTSLSVNKPGNYSQSSSQTSSSSSNIGSDGKPYKTPIYPDDSQKGNNDTSKFTSGGVSTYKGPMTPQADLDSMDSNDMTDTPESYSSNLNKKLDRRVNELSANLMRRMSEKMKNRRQIEDGEDAPMRSIPAIQSGDPLEKSLPIQTNSNRPDAEIQKMASQATGSVSRPAVMSPADKQQAARAASKFESRLVDMEDDEYWLMEAGKASRAFCKANSRKRSNMGASQLSSCISQGYLPHKSGKSVKVADRRIKLDGVKMKGEKYGGPKSTKAGEST